MLRNLRVRCPNHVWAMDITYIPMARGFVYLVAVMDWYSRRVLSWKLSTTMDVHCCLEAVEAAIDLYGTPEIINTDQGSQFTSEAFTKLLRSKGIHISMDGKGAWQDTIFVERLWRSVNYEEVYLHAYETIPMARAGVECYFRFYNSRRPHSRLDHKTPDEVYLTEQPVPMAA